MLDFVIWVVLVVLAICVLTGSISGTVLAWSVIGLFIAFAVLSLMLVLASKN
jgi:hypothetical protein